jgi:hypothetical protein
MPRKLLLFTELERSKIGRWWDAWGIHVVGILLPIAFALALSAFILPGR